MTFEREIMHHYAYLVALYMLCEYHHSGQWSKGYHLLCLAQTRGEREHGFASVARSADQCRKWQLYKKNGEFRRAVAYYLFKLRKYRHDL